MVAIAWTLWVTGCLTIIVMAGRELRAARRDAADPLGALGPVSERCRARLAEQADPDGQAWR